MIKELEIPIFFETSALEKISQSVAHIMHNNCPLCGPVEILQKIQKDFGELTF